MIGFRTLARRFPDKNSDTRHRPTGETGARPGAQVNPSIVCVTENNGIKRGLEATPRLVETGAGLHQRPAMDTDVREGTSVEPCTCRDPY